MTGQHKKDSIQDEQKGGAPRPEGTRESSAEQMLLETGEKLRQAESKAEENWNLFLRARADFENYRKTMLRDRDASIRRGKRDLFLKLLDIRDNFDRALGGAHPSVDTLRSGIEIVARQIDSLLKAEGIEPVESVGRAFDPAVHEAIATWESPDVTEDTCTDEVQKGYTYEGEVLRPARVRVGRPKATQ